MSRAAARDDLGSLEAVLGHRFADAGLARLALTHVSSVTSRDPRASSYQRLEFLGDRVLGLAVSAMLYEEFPGAAEGELSRRLADLVRRESCAEVAADWCVGPLLRLGSGEAQSGGRGRQAILSDACEALIGAVFLDGGFLAADALVRRAWGPRMRAPRRALQDPKTALQEWAQARGKPTPSYTESGRSGPAHAPRFTVTVAVEGCETADGTGTSKRYAEQAAAEAFMTREGFPPTPPTPSGATEP